MLMVYSRSTVFKHVSRTELPGAGTRNLGVVSADPFSSGSANGLL